MRTTLLRPPAVRKAKNRIEVILSSGNVFADLGLPNAEEKQTQGAPGFCHQRDNPHPGAFTGRSRSAPEQQSAEDFRASELSAPRFLCRTLDELSHRPRPRRGNRYPPEILKEERRTHPGHRSMKSGRSRVVSGNVCLRCANCSNYGRLSPAMNRAVKFSVDRQVRPLIRIARRQGFI